MEKNQTTTKNPTMCVDIIDVIEEILEYEPDDVVPYCILCCNAGHYYAIDQVVICPCLNVCHASQK